MCTVGPENPATANCHPPSLPIGLCQYRCTDSEHMTPPGWYPDPYRFNWLRYWNGTQWTENSAPAQQQHTQQHLPQYPPQYLPQTVYPETQKVKSWGLGDVAVGFGIFFLASGILVVLTLLIAALSGPDSLANISENGITGGGFASIAIIIASGIGSATAFLGVPLYATYFKGKKSLTKDFGLKFKLADLPLGLGMAAAGMLASVAVTVTSQSIFGENVTNTGGLPTSFSGPNIILIAVMLIVVAGIIPVVEEVFFRGLMLKAVEKRYSTKAAIITTSIVFGFAHLGGATSLGGVVSIPIVTGIYGLIFALAAVKTQRIGSSVIAHIIINTTAVVALFAAG